jgi:hypothetical protein
LKLNKNPHGGRVKRYHAIGYSYTNDFKTKSEITIPNTGSRTIIKGWKIEDEGLKRKTFREQTFLTVSVAIFRWRLI